MTFNPNLMSQAPGLLFPLLALMDTAGRALYPMFNLCKHSSNSLGESPFPLVDCKFLENKVYF